VQCIVSEKMCFDMFAATQLCFYRFITIVVWR